MIIYCIEDINDLKYIGSTSRTLSARLNEHRYKKRNNLTCSSKLLNLDYCIIYELETCDDKERLEREKHYINTIDCVNEIKYTGGTFNRKKWNYDYYHKNINKMRKYNRDYYAKNYKR